MNKTIHTLILSLQKIAIVFLFFPFTTYCQFNLVNNPSFEVADSLTYCNPTIYFIDHWAQGSNGMVRYFSGTLPPSCNQSVPINLYSDYQPARTGIGYSSVRVYQSEMCGQYRSYLKTQLETPLIAANKYYVEYWAAPATKIYSNSVYTTFELDAYFTDVEPDYHISTTLFFNPQIDNYSSNVILNSGSWTKVSGYMEASGGEEWMVIGNFYNNGETEIFEIPGYPPNDNDTIQSILFVDDVLVKNFSNPFLNDAVVCVGDTVTLSAYFGDAEYEWSTGDTTSEIQVTTSGDYWVVVSNEQGTITDTSVVYFIPDTTFTSFCDTLICYNYLPAVLYGSPEYDSYIWSNGSPSDHLSAHTEGLYILNATHGCNFFIDSFLVSITPQIIDNFFLPDTTICPGDYFTVTAPDGFENYIWNTGATIQQFIIYEAGDYWVAYSDSCYNFSEEFTVKLDPYSTKNLELGDDIDLCSYTNFPITIDAGEWPAYLWSNGSTERYLQPNKPGEYSVTVYNNCGQKSDTIFINDCTEGTEDLLLMPNLSEGEFWLLNTPAEWTPQTTIYIYSMQGLVDKLQSTIDGFTRLDLTQYMKGAYWIIAEADGRQFFFKIIIQ